jgi:hypothetical protein
MDGLAVRIPFRSFLICFPRGKAKPKSPIPFLVDNGILSEILTFQMEYKYLAKLTGRANYYHHVRLSPPVLTFDIKPSSTPIQAENAMKLISEAPLDEFGLLPSLWNLEQGTTASGASLRHFAFRNAH